MRQFVYCKRVFPASAKYRKESYICAIAESSNGTNEAAEYVIILADCNHAVELEFSLINPRKEKKVSPRLIFSQKSLTEFREALHTEAKAIESAKQNCR